MQRQFALYEVLLIFFVTVTMLMVAISLDFPLYLAIIPGFLLISFFGRRNGFQLRDVLKSSKKGIKRNVNVAWLLFFIGLLLPTWYYSGTINHLNELFLSLISPTYFLPTVKCFHLFLFMLDELILSWRGTPPTQN